MSGLPGQQMAGRYRTVALQAVAVALIAAFIFIAFLRPLEPGSLFGIDAPGGDDTPVAARPDPPDDDEKDEQDNKNGSNRGGPSERLGGAGISGSGASGSGSSTSGESGSGPTSDQYEPSTIIFENNTGSGSGSGTGSGTGSGIGTVTGSGGGGLNESVGALPFTGFDVIAMLAVALAVTGLGLALQRAVSREIDP